jgi:hypothetical protein
MVVAFAGLQLWLRRRIVRYGIRDGCSSDDTIKEHSGVLHKRWVNLVCLTKKLILAQNTQGGK